MANPTVVVGSGIVGSAIAWQLQDRGVQVVLVERDVRPRGASFGSFASLTAFDEPIGAVYALKCLGMSHWRRWQRELGDDIGLRWDGETRWAETNESAQLLQSMADRARYRGYPVKMLSKAELMEALPRIRPREVLAASHVGSDGQADPPVAIASLQDAFKEAGGTSLVGQVTLGFDDDEVYVRVDDQTLRAASVVVAAGAETHAFLEKLGFDIPMDPSPGLLVQTEPLGRMVTGTVYVYPSAGVPLHLRQRPDGKVVIGERSQEYAAEKPTSEHAEQLLRQAAKSFPDLANAEVDHFSVQWRPMPNDRMPIVGPLPGLPSVYVATAHAGVTLAPAIAGLVAQELIDRQPADQLREFRPSRFAKRQAELTSEIESSFQGPTEIFLG